MQRLSMCLVALALLGGCTLQAPERHPELAAEHRGVPLPETTQALFDRAGGPPVVLQSSPWGQEVTVALEAVYTAASGRRCRGFVVRGQDTRPGLACRDDAGWVEVRVLHHDGRPVLEASR